MIRTIKNINGISSIKVSTEIDLKSIESIDFDDEIIGSGGFGKVHRILSIDGVQRSEFVIKIFSDKENEAHGYDTIEKLHLKLKKRELETSIPAYVEHPELLGIPFVTLNGYDEIEETDVTAFIMLDLNKLGFIDYGAENNNNNQSYKNLDFKDKIYISHQLAIAIEFLHNIKFIHSDIKEAALWYHPQKKQLALIDFDSGYHFDTQEKPSTLGAIGHWISGGLRNIIGSDYKENKITVKERLSEEHWILSNALFELTFGVMPYFFLKDSDDITKKKYLKKYKWPKIDIESEEFLKENEHQYDLLISTISNLREAGLNGLLDNFSTVFNAGYTNNTKRITPKAWSSFLGELNESLNNVPVILNFSSDKTEISEKDELVKLSFKTDYARYVSIQQKFYSPILTSSADIICISKKNTITIQAFNKTGISVNKLLINSKSRNPKIETFSVNKTIRDSLDPLTLSWITKDIKHVIISNISGEFNGNSKVNIEPTNKTTYKLSAFGYFDEYLESELTVDIVKPRIKRFDWEINLNEGIKNIDLIWDTEFATEVRIEPKIGVKSANGFQHISIDKETKFMLSAIGLFSNTTAEVNAHPFPAPIIKQIFVETPVLNINTAIESVDLKTFRKLDNSINNINSGINFLKTLELPKLESENLLDKNDLPIKELSINSILKRIKNITNKA